MELPAPNFSPDSYVIVRAWLPTNYGKTVSYPEAVLRRTFTPSNNHAHIGHVSICIRHGDREQYVSLYPTESHFVTTSPVVNHTLEEDIKDQEALPPTMQAILFSLDTKKMLAEFDNMQPRAHWFLSGIKCINPAHEKVYNCSSYAEKLLNEGGIYTHLLTSNEKLSKPMTPQDVCELAKRAATIERKIYPQTLTALEQYKQIFSNEMITKSKDKENPCEALNIFLRDNPDFYLRVNEIDPKPLATLLPIVYQNLQQHHNERLLQLVENFNPQDSFNFLLEIEKLLHNGANLSLYNKDGFNALHLMIKKNCFTGVALILDRCPQAVNCETKNQSDDPGFQPKTTLDLAIESGDEKIISLIKRYGGMTKQCKDNINSSANNFNPRLFSDKNKLNALLKQDEKRSLSFGVRAKG